MQIFKLLNLFFTLTLLNLYSTKCNEDIKMEYLFNQVIEPYNNHLTTFTEELKSFKNSLAYILFNTNVQEKNLFGDDSEYKPASPVDLGSKKDTIQAFQDQIEVGQHNRMLQESSVVCLNGGVTVQASVSTYTCDGETLAKAEYEARNNKAGCRVETNIKEYCYCPYDFFGEQCENFNGIICEVTRISHPLTACMNKKSNYYVYTHGQGDMPCYTVNKNSNLDMEFNVKCRNMESKWNFEGIKTEESDYQIINKPENPFLDYNINTPDLKMSFYRLAELSLKFANWHRIFKPHMFKTSLSTEQATGQKNVVFNVNMELLTEEFCLSGRYYYEVVFEPNYPTYNKVTGVLEDASYVEPTKTKPYSSYRLFYYIVGICFLVALVFTGFKFRKVLPFKWRARSDSYEPLMEMTHLHED